MGRLHCSASEKLVSPTGHSILAAFSRMHSTGHCQTETDDFELAQDLVKKMDAWPNVFKLDLRGHGGVTPGARGVGSLDGNRRIEAFVEIWGSGPRPDM